MDVAASAYSGRCLNKNPENIELECNRASNSTKFGFDKNWGKINREFFVLWGLSVFPINELGLSCSGGLVLITSSLYFCYNPASA